MKKLLIISIFLILVTNINAQEFPSPYDKYVNDFAKIFNQEEITELKTILSQVEENTTAEVVIVTIQTSKPLTPSQYRTGLFNKWKIGKVDKDNGLLILYSLQENRIEIETGYGLEGILPDSKLGRLLDKNYVPYRDKKQVNQGIILFTKEVAKIINENKDEIISVKKNELSLNFKILSIIINLMPIIFFIIFMIIIFRILNTGKKKCNKHNLEMKYLGLIAGYYVYECAKGHKEKVLKSFSNSYLGGRYGGGFSGGGFSSGGFSGGFGGGMSGGGGVGR